MESDDEVDCEARTPMECLFFLAMKTQVRVWGNKWAGREFHSTAIHYTNVKALQRFDALYAHVEHKGGATR